MAHARSVGLTPDDSALSNKITKMFQKETEEKNHEMIKLHDENGIRNVYLEMKVPGSGAEVTTADGTWKQSCAHPWRGVGALAGQRGVEDLQPQREMEAMRAMNRGTWSGRHCV